MSIIKCYECCGKLSDKANSCPHCGAPSKNINYIKFNINNQKSSLAYSLEKIVGILLILFAVIIITSVLMNPSQMSASISDFFFCLGLIAVPIYFGFKLYNQTDILIVFVNWIKKGFKE